MDEFGQALAGDLLRHLCFPKQRISRPRSGIFIPGFLEGQQRSGHESCDGLAYLHKPNTTCGSCTQLTDALK